MQTLIPLKIESGCLLVRSTLPKSEYEEAGSRYGYQYEWRINKYLFTKNKKETMDRLGLTEEEYNKWSSLITF